MRISTWFVCWVVSAGVFATSVTGCNGTVDGARPTDAGHDANHDAAIPFDSGTDPDADTFDAGLPIETRDVCTVDGWCWELPHPQGHDLRSVWASAVDDIWAVGINGLILHYDGIGWSRSQTTSDVALNTVFGIASDDIWAAGDEGIVLHFDGAAWSPVNTAPDADAMPPPPARALHAIWASAADDVWFAGDNGRLFHFDGDGFELVASNTNVGLRSLYGSATDDIWAVGLSGTLLHFDGDTWTSATSPITAGLLATSGYASDDLWAVGNRAALHWDGTEWVDVSTGLDGFARAVVAVEPWSAAPLSDAGDITDAAIADASLDASPSDAGVEAPTLAWAFGDAGKVWAFAGGHWSAVESNLSTGFLAASALTEDSDLLAVGQGGVMQRWLNGARQTLSVGSRATRLTTFVDDRNTLWVGGDEIITRRENVWALQMPPTERALFGLWGSGNELWAVGTAGTVLRLDGAHWIDASPVAANNTWLRSIHGVAGSAWIVGNDGLALTRAAGTWTRVNTPRNVSLRDVWTLAEDDAWAVGDEGTALRWNGTEWRATNTTLAAASLRAVWASATDDVWAAGSLGTVIHWDGSAWSTAMTGGSYSLDDIRGRDGKLWAVGNAGTILHFDGERWSAEQSGTTHNLHSITIDGEGVLWTVGDQGTVLSNRLMTSAR